ncbi:MAG TPA: pitrilysin family protein, partial [Candidatus Polarisedimenticolia bacterium]|nr:pitrilysin family protein [Candidatus Polarisedimenticolia bacterium]
EAPAAPGPPPADPRLLSYPDLSISFPKPERVFLPNGLLIYLFVDHELPLIDLGMYVKTGSIYDPPEKAGLAEVATLLMRTGGTRDLTPDQVDEALEFMPARLSLDAGTDAVAGSLSTRKESFPDALKILAAMLTAPRFDADRLALEKARLVEEIHRRWDDPGTIADLNFRLLVYGARSPWARLETPETLAAITRQDLVDFQTRYFHPNNTVLGVAGDFQPAAMKALLKDVLGSWRQAKITPPKVAPIKDDIPAGLHLIDRTLTQSSVEIGHLGISRFDPDKFPLKIASFILGEGGFASRLVQEVRSTRGLAYAVGGGVGIDSDRGLFEISCRTRARSTVEAIEVIRDVLQRFHDDGPTDDEVARAKESEINSFVFSLDGTVPYMQAFLYYDLYGYPRDYLQTYRDHLSKVTRADVARAIRRHIDPDRLVILVVGDPDAFDPPLAALKLGTAAVIRLNDDGTVAAAPASR